MKNITGLLFDLWNGQLLDQQESEFQEVDKNKSVADEQMRISRWMNRVT